MKLARLLNADAGLSVLLHGLKALVALFVNWLVLRHFAVTDFVTWSVTSSILVVATASDLGIGQYAVTRMINSERDRWPEHVGAALGALVPLVAAAAMFVLLAIDGPTLAYKAAMAALLAGRIVTIPFAAVLNAANQFKIRKAIELTAYGLAALGVGAVVLAQADVHWALLTLNASFLLGAVLTALAARRYAPVGRSVARASVGRSARVFRAAIPFMANNLSGLLTYGGFVWLSSLVLPRVEVATLAVLHGFVLVNMYQMYDVVLKARQADLAVPARLAPYRRLNLLLMLLLPPAFVLAGREALALIGNPVAIDLLVAALFGLFMACELGNLFAQSITQVNLALVGRLNAYSALRTTMLAGGFVVVGIWPGGGVARVELLLGLLTLGSLATFVYLQHGIPARGEPARRPLRAALEE